MNANECQKNSDSFLALAKLEMRGARKTHLLFMAQAWLRLADLYEQDQVILRAIQAQSAHD
jgi:hypothetical protein